MIKIFVSHYKLKITGHEISNNKYKLICCAVSAISLSGINCFKRNDVKYISNSGFLEVNLRNITFKNKIMWKMLINQLYLLHKQYKKIILWKGKEK